MGAGTTEGILPESEGGVSILTGRVTGAGEGEGVGCLAEAFVGGSWTGKLAAMDIQRTKCPTMRKYREWKLRRAHRNNKTKLLTVAQLRRGGKRTNGSSRRGSPNIWNKYVELGCALLPSSRTTGRIP